MLSGDPRACHVSLSSSEMFHTFSMLPFHNQLDNLSSTLKSLAFYARRILSQFKHLGLAMSIIQFVWIKVT